MNVPFFFFVVLLLPPWAPETTKGYPTWLGLSKWGGRRRELGEETVMGKRNRKEKVRDPPCKRLGMARDLG
ncbi:hypothetical protein V8C34DRAFT_12598 [Trichoderma compactum]